LAVITGRRAFLELLKQEGVDILFGNPGTTELPLMDALAAEDGIGVQSRGVVGLV
jgi:benzoylformate decarboxylase